MLDIVLAPLDPIVSPVLALVNGVIQFGLFLVEVLQFLPRALELFNYIINPMKIIKDIIAGLVNGITMILEAMLDVLLGDIRKAMGGSYDPGSNDGDYSGEKGVCLSKTFMGTLLMVLCPPLYVLLNMGIINGFFPTLLTSVLTYFYYIPGLIYASLYSFCPN